MQSLTLPLRFAAPPRTAIDHALSQVLDPWCVAVHYAKGFLIADVIAVIPWIVQVVLIATNDSRADVREETWYDAVRLLRLARLRSLGTLGVEGARNGAGWRNSTYFL